MKTEIVISRESDEVLTVFAAVALGAPDTASGREAYRAALLNLRLRIRELEGTAEPLDKAMNNLETAFISWGRSGANHDVLHHLREPWVRAREILVAAGRIK